MNDLRKKSSKEIQDQLQKMSQEKHKAINSLELDLRKAKDETQKIAESKDSTIKQKDEEIKLLREEIARLKNT